MKKVLMALCVIGLVAGAASADSLAVNGTAAMEGDYGMELTHDNSSTAYVQDNTPEDETLYRGSFLFNAHSVTGHSINFRQVIFQGYGNNPNPGVGVCPANPDASVGSIRIWLFQTGGDGRFSSIQFYSRGNQCGERSTPRIPINNDQDYRICFEWSTGATNTGEIALAVVDPASSCPTSGDPAWVTSTISNNLNDVDLVRMGTPALNNFGAGETATMYFDSFESYRTLTP